MTRKSHVAGLTLILAALGTAACDTSSSSEVAIKPGGSVASSEGVATAGQDPRFLATDLPLLPVGVERGVMPLPVIQAAYEFAARHPEVMHYVPCFCGCERGGHKDNHDCFVSARDGNRVVAWEPHGLVCEICISVAQQARQMHTSGASIADIRKAIEARYAAISADRHNHTPTPMPPKSGSGDDR